MKIVLRINDRHATATLNGSAAARDFGTLLPLELTLDDYHGTEKISSLPKRLDMTQAPTGMDPQAGDITYFSPWGNLAMFYKDFGYSRGLIPLGRLDAGLDILTFEGSAVVRIEAAD